MSRKYAEIAPYPYSSLLSRLEMTNEIQALAKDLIDDAIVTGKKEIVIVTCGNSRSVTPSEFSELKQIITLTLPDVILKYEPTV